MNKLYFLLPDGNCVTRVPKSASHSLAQAITQNFYPESMEGVNDLLPEGLRFEDINLWLSLVPQSKSSQGTIFAVIRDPLQRFLSTCAMLRLSVDEGLISDDPHFLPQSFFVTGAECFLLPNHEAEFCGAVNLPYPLPLLASFPDKTIPTDSQIAEIKDKYKDDITLIEMI